MHKDICLATEIIKNISTYPYEFMRNSNKKDKMNKILSQNLLKYRSTKDMLSQKEEVLIKYSL